MEIILPERILRNSRPFQFFVSVIFFLLICGFGNWGILGKKFWVFRRGENIRSFAMSMNKNLGKDGIMGLRKKRKR